MDLLERAPRKGQVWRHTASGRTYEIEGTTFNSITDQIEVSYKPLYPCEFERFNRQLIGHPKSWLSFNADGSPRFERIDNQHPQLPLGDEAA